MARYLGPKHKHCRREGMALCGLAKCPANRNQNPPGQHGPKGRRKISEYGIQLREKQKVKRIYGVLERQFRRYFKEAKKKRENTGEVLLQLLETRLDNIIYRLGFSATRPAARQLVSHYHVLVNEKRVNIPSYQVKSGQVITINQKALEIPQVKKTFDATKNDKLPDWLERKAVAGKIKHLPTREDIAEDINDQLIVEYYSR